MKRVDNYKSGIYFLFENGDCVPYYIGKSTNIFSRVYQHGPHCCDYFKYIETINDSETLNFVERWLIWIIQPEYNRAGKSPEWSSDAKKTPEERFNMFCELFQATTPRKPRKLTLDTISEFVYATALWHLQRGA